MRIKFLNLLILGFVFSDIVNAQDSVKVLNDVNVKSYRTVNGIGHFFDYKDGVIFAGKKNELIITDSLDANKAINNTRQILGRIPGLNIVETENGGFTANGIATRGLNPTQSIEMNTRQNGYNISADVYGNNEAYYIPPMEAVNRIELIRGASSLQFGTQFGGMVNYILKDAPVNKPFESTFAQTFGSNGLFNSYNSIAGNNGKIKYFGYLQYRRMDGYRPNSQQTQISGFGKLSYEYSKKFNFSLEYTLMRNQIQMPGGLTDSLFQQNSKQSLRARNWLTTPWNIISVGANWNPTDRTNLVIKANYLFSQRSLVWRNEDGGAGAIDIIDPATMEYVPREVEKENMKNITTEIRLNHKYQFGKLNSMFAAGARVSHAWFKRLGGGEGTTGTDFNLTTLGDWEYNYDFETNNIAPFIENIFYLNDRFTITPGIRWETINNKAKGFKDFDSYKVLVDNTKNRNLILKGIGLEYKFLNQTSLYANLTESYRPIDYNQLSPFGVSSRIAPDLTDQTGSNADFGYRGIIRNYLNFDFSAFIMHYNNRIGVIVLNDPLTNEEYSLRKNIGNSIHQGFESYVEFNVLKFLNEQSKNGLSIFNSYSYIDAHYTSGIYKNNRVEVSTKNINRVGISFHNKWISTTLQDNFIGDAFGDATNVYKSDNPVAGLIPSYQVFDFSGSFKQGKTSIKSE